MNSEIEAIKGNSYHFGRNFEDVSVTGFSKIELG